MTYPLTEKEKERLRELAEAATPGPWTTIERGSYWGEEEGDVIDGETGESLLGAENVEPIGNVPSTRGALWLRDAQYIVAAQPGAVLALLVELAAKDAELRALRGLQAMLDRPAVIRWRRIAGRSQWTYEEVEPGSDTSWIEPTVAGGGEVEWLAVIDRRAGKT